MTAFILVSGMFTGTHIWQDTVARLTAAGAEVHTVALTGLDGPRAAGDGAVDLETHIADVLAVVDSVLDPAGGAEDGDRRIVLVGHDYGIHPAVGAVDRRAERIERIVYLDSGLPRDGVPALAAVPDQSLRDSVAGTAGSSGADEDRGVLPPPALGEWSRWGSTAGVPDAALDRLTALAAPSPWAPCSSRCG